MNEYFLAAAKAGAVVSIRSDSPLYSAVEWHSPKMTKAELEPFIVEAKWDLVRIERDRLLAKTDWSQLVDTPQATKDTYAVYRQELRDITTQANPDSVVWPVAP